MANREETSLGTEGHYFCSRLQKIANKNIYAEELKDLVRLTQEQRDIGPESTHSQRWTTSRGDIRDHATEDLRARALKMSLRRLANQARLAFAQRPTAANSLQT